MERRNSSSEANSKRWVLLRSNGRYAETSTRGKTDICAASRSTGMACSSENGSELAEPLLGGIRNERTNLPNVAMAGRSRSMDLYCSGALRRECGAMSRAICPRDTYHFGPVRQSPWDFYYDPGPW